MSDFHIPDLDEISQLTNPAIKLYAAIGAGISLTARIELSYIEIFRKATQLDREMAMRTLAVIRNASNQRDIANSVMQQRFQDDVPQLQAWNDLYSRITRLTGSSGYRNLIAHMPVKEIRRGGRRNLLLLGAGGSRPPDYKIAVDQIGIIALKRGKSAPQEATAGEILNFCHEAIILASDIESYLSQLP